MIERPFHALTKLETSLLIGFVFTLPLFEAPKNIFLFVFLGLWVFARRSSIVSTPVSFSDWPLILILVLGFLSSLLSDLPGPRTLDAVDFTSIGLLYLVISRTPLPDRALYFGLFVLLLGVFAGLAADWFFGSQLRPGLNSVGHINQVAIYLATMTALVLGFFAGTNHTRLRPALLFMGLCLFLVVLLTGSRNAVFAILIVFFIGFALLLFSNDRWRFPYLVVGLVALMFLIGLNPEALHRQWSTLVSAGSLDPAREKLLYTAWFVGQHKPFLGFGVGSWETVTSPLVVMEMVQRAGLPYIPYESRFFFHPHAHNLLANWFVERGGLAVILLLYWMLSVATTFVRVYRRHLHPVMSAGILVLCVTFWCGLGNTSLHHEHGLLAALILGAAMSRIRYV